MGIQLFAQLVHAMDRVNTGHRVWPSQFPEPDDVVTGQTTPEFICSSPRLTTDHVSDLPTATERSFQSPRPCTAARSQHGQMIVGQTGQTCQANGFRCRKNPGVNPCSCTPGSRSGSAQLTRSQGKKQTTTSKITIREIRHGVQH